MHQVMQHFMNLPNMGEIESASSVRGVGNPVCGGLMQIQLRRDSY
ncbi:MAG: iron-sulfur cluster assembly scaffold protein, partial [Halobacteriota archaeon]